MVEHGCQCRGMAAVYGEHDGLAPVGPAADSVSAHEALFVGVAEFAHQSAVAFGDGELAFQRAWIHSDGVRAAEQFLEFRPRFLIQSVPIDLVSAHREAVFGGGLYRHRPIDAIGNEMALLDGAV